MLRVLQVIHGMDLGGAENFIMNIYRKLDRSEIQFDFLVNQPGTFDEEIQKMGGRIYQIPYVNPVGPFRYRKELEKFFREHSEYSVVHSHLDKVSGIVVECAKKAGVKTCITHSHSTNTTGNIPTQMLKNYYQKKIKHYVDVRLACSVQAARWLYGTEKEVLIVKNGIDTEKFRFSQKERENLRRAYQIEEEAVVIGHVGRFMKVKNHAFLLKIFQAFLWEHPNAYLLLCGEGAEMGVIQTQAKQEGLQNRVIFTGARKDVFRMYHMMDVFVFPSLYEGISLAMVEAQTNGLPVVASDTIDRGSKLTDCVKFVELRAEPMIWKSEIESVLERKRQKKREEQVIEIREQEFDIENTKKKLLECYREGAEGERIVL